MLRLSFITYTLLYFLSIPELSGQIAQVWDRQPAGTEGFKAFDVKLLRKQGGKQMAIAGECTRGKVPFAVLYLADCKSGAIADSLVVPGGGFRAVAESENGALYVGGYRMDKSSNRVGWMIRHHFGNHATDLDTLLTETDSITKMTWLDRSGLAFASFKKDDGSIRVFTLGRKGARLKSQPSAIGNGIFKNISAVVPAASNEVWLTGNSQAGQSLLLKIDEKGMFNNAPIALGDAKVYEEVTTAALNEKGQIVLAGATKINSGDDDPWILKPSVKQPDKNENAVNFSLETIGDDRITAVTNTNCHDFLVLVQQKNGRAVKNNLHQVMGNAIERKPLFVLAGEQFFKPANFLRDEIMEETYYLVGAVSDIDSKNRRLRIVCLQEQCAKGKSGVKETTPPAGGKGNILPNQPTSGPILKVENMELTQPDNPEGSGALSAKSEVIVRFTIAHEGEDMVAPGEIEVIKTSLVSGLSIDLEDMKQPFPALKSTRKRHVVRIRLTTGDRVVAGTSSFTMAIRAGGRELLSSNSPIIETGKTATGSTFVSWENKGERSTDQERAVRKIIIHTPNPNVQAHHVETGGTGMVKQHKANPKLSSRQFSDGMYTYTFEIDFPLDTGKNEIFVKLADSIGGARTETLTIERNSNPPNLYIIAIGVPYQNLHFTDDDAADFLAAAKKMAGGTPFGEVKMARLLNTPASTTREAIQDAFNGLTSQQHIRPTDYVMVLISSHGDIYHGSSQDRFFILPYDYEPGNSTTPRTTEDQSKTAEQGSDARVTRPFYYYNMIEILKDINCRRFVFIDACHSGLAKGANRDSLIKQANEAAPGLVCFLSSSAQQLSYEYEKGKNGVFTQALLEAMLGQPVTLFRDSTQTIAPNPDGDKVITIAELRDFLSVRVQDLLLDTQYKQHKQTPVYFNPPDVNQLPDNQAVFTVPKG